MIFETSGGKDEVFCKYAISCDEHFVLPPVAPYAKHMQTHAVVRLGTCIISLYLACEYDVSNYVTWIVQTYIQ